MPAGLVFSLVFLSQSCSVFLSCDISTVILSSSLIQGSFLVALVLGKLCLHSKRTCITPSSCVALSLDLTRASGAALAAVERVSGLLYLSGTYVDPLW